jgi:hypothetical protein
MKLSEDKESMIVKCKDGDYKIIAEGDCCSQSWIEHYDPISEGSLILDIIEKECINLKECNYDSATEEYNDELDQYFYEIKTDKGDFMIEMRNENNGYYGGELYVEGHRYD